MGRGVTHLALVLGLSLATFSSAVGEVPTPLPGILPCVTNNPLAMQWGLDVDSLDIEVRSRYMWRGYVRGSGPAVRSTLSVPIFGQPLTALGCTGLSLRFTGWTSLRNRDARTDGDQASASVVFEHLLGEERLAAITLGVSGFVYEEIDPMLPSYGSEIWASVAFPLNVVGEQAFTVELEYSRDFSRFEANMGRVTVSQGLPTENRFPFQLELFLEAGGRFSDYPAADRSARSFGFHSVEVALRVRRTFSFGDERSLGLEFSGGFVGPSSTIGPDVGWGGLRLKLTP